MDEVIETQESPRRNRRGTALAAGGLLVVVALVAAWLVARDDPDGVQATNAGEEVAPVYRLPADADRADVEIDPGGIVACDCELEEVGTYPLISADDARDAIASGVAFTVNEHATGERDVSDSIGELGAAIWPGTNITYVVPTWRFTLEAGDVVEVLAIDPGALFAPSSAPESTTTTTTGTEFENTQTTLIVDDTDSIDNRNVPDDPTETTEAGTAPIKGVLHFDVANYDDEPAELFIGTPDNTDEESLTLEPGERKEIDLTVAAGCVEFTITEATSGARATESVMIGRAPVDVYANYDSTEPEPILIGLEVPEAQIGCAP
jgi:hypothetical protein